MYSWDLKFYTQTLLLWGLAKFVLNWSWTSIIPSEPVRISLTNDSKCVLFGKNSASEEWVTSGSRRGSYLMWDYLAPSTNQMASFGWDKKQNDPA